MPETRSIFDQIGAMTQTQYESVMHIKKLCVGHNPATVKATDSQRGITITAEILPANSRAGTNWQFLIMIYHVFSDKDFFDFALSVCLDYASGESMELTPHGIGTYNGNTYVWGKMRDTEAEYRAPVDTGQSSQPAAPAPPIIDESMRQQMSSFAAAVNAGLTETRKAIESLESTFRTHGSALAQLFKQQGQGLADIVEAIQSQAELDVLALGRLLGQSEVSTLDLLAYLQSDLSDSYPAHSMTFDLAKLSSSSSIDDLQKIIVAIDAIMDGIESDTSFDEMSRILRLMRNQLIYLINLKNLPH